MTIKCDRWIKSTIQLVKGKRKRTYTFYRTMKSKFQKQKLICMQNEVKWLRLENKSTKKKVWNHCLLRMVLPTGAKRKAKIEYFLRGNAALSSSFYRAPYNIFIVWCCKHEMKMYLPLLRGPFPPRGGLNSLWVYSLNEDRLQFCIFFYLSMTFIEGLSDPNNVKK